ncbi:MAG: hypothetical protein Tsb009_17260 [Planctomycetaceae bacterium]
MKIKVEPEADKRGNESLSEKILDEAKQGGPSFLFSLLIHMMLLFIFWIVVAPGGIDLSGGGGLTVDLEISEDEEKAGEQNQPDIKDRKPIFNAKVQPIPKQDNTQKKKAGTKKGKPVGKGPKPQPVKPVQVKKLFLNRNPKLRDEILKKLDPEEKIRRAISAGLQWLKRHQNSTGNWQLHRGYPDPGYEFLPTDTGATALALLAFLGDGHTHMKRGPYQETIRKGLKWLVGVQKRDGDLHDSQELGRQTAFYAHSQATIVLCEAYAMTGDETLKEPAERAVKFLVDSQNPVKGGWKYQPQGPRSRGDLSVTGWALMALHSARAAGLKVPEDAFELSSLFLDEVQEDDGARYRYEPQPTPRPVTPTMTAEGLLCRQFLGWSRKHAPLRDGVAYLLQPENKPRWIASGQDDPHVYYWYYAGHVLHNMGGKPWENWYRDVSMMIVSHQEKSSSRKRDVRGSWNPKDKKGVYYGYGKIGGRLYVTTLCLLVLEMPYRHSSIYTPTKSEEADSP